MKVKYEGPRDEVTFRHVTFAKGKAVELSEDSRADMLLAEKVLALDAFSEVKTTARKSKNDKDSA